MDPLSVTAGIIAILGAGGVVGKRITILTALKSAPDELLILNNEISDLQYVLNDVQDLLRRQPDDHGAPVPFALTKALQQSRETVLALEKLIAYDLTVIDSRSKVPRVDKSRWLRAVKNLVDLQEQNPTEQARGLSSFCYDGCVSFWLQLQSSTACR